MTTTTTPQAQPATEIDALRERQRQALERLAGEEARQQRIALRLNEAETRVAAAWSETAVAEACWPSPRPAAPEHLNDRPPARLGGAGGLSRLGRPVRVPVGVPAGPA